MSQYQNTLLTIRWSTILNCLSTTSERDLELEPETDGGNPGCSPDQRLAGHLRRPQRETVLELESRPDGCRPVDGFRRWHLKGKNGGCVLYNFSHTYANPLLSRLKLSKAKWHRGSPVQKISFRGQNCGSIFVLHQPLGNHRWFLNNSNSIKKLWGEISQFFTNIRFLKINYDLKQLLDFQNINYPDY